MPLGLVFAIAPLAWSGEPAFLLLLLAAGVQLADIGIGLSAEKKEMIFGATVATVIHVLCALVVR